MADKHTSRLARYVNINCSKAATMFSIRAASSTPFILMGIYNTYLSYAQRRGPMTSSSEFLSSTDELLLSDSKLNMVELMS